MMTHLKQASSARRSGGWRRWRRPAGVLLVALLSGLLPLLGRTPRQGAAAMPAEQSALLEATIPELQAALAAGSISSRQLVELYLARIQAYDQQGPGLNAISAINSHAFAEADALDSERRAKGSRGPLHGIPVIVKDNYDTNDLQTAAGSILFKGWIPPDDAFLVQKLRAAGAIIIAKANMHEFAWSWETLGSLFGQTHNPYALDRVPGGSSGGTGAAITANFAAVGLGSDTCGSIRVPSAENSLVGLRATQGLLSRTGIIPLAHTQDIGGPMGRSVTDVATTLDALVGYDPADRETVESLGHVPASYAAFLQADSLRGARIGVLTDLFSLDPADPAVTDVVRAAADELRGQGAEVVELSIPNLAGLISSAYSSVIVNEFKFDLDAYLAAHPSAPVHSLDEIVASGKYAPEIDSIMKRTDAMETLETQDYYTKLAHRTEVRQATLTALADNGLDALVYPTVREKPVLIGEGTQTGVNCNLSAQSGLPALTVPAGFTADGIPVGMEMLGPAWSEGKLIGLAYAYEQATHHRRPPASTPALAAK
ncbi:MAG: amidase family protein [Dehalococcoidia bacterium]